MKRLIAIIMTVMMLATLAVGASASGEILFTDDFTAGFLATNWILEGNLFFLDDSTDNPCLAAYSDGVVCQAEYRDEINGNARWFTNCAMSMRINVRDFDEDGSHKVGFWWRDDFAHTPDDSDPGYELGEIWNLLVDVDNMTVMLLVEGEEAPRVEVPVTGIEVAEDEWFTLGWRVVSGRMEGFVNDVKLIDYSSDEIAAVHKSPFLLINSNCYVAFDDLIVATADYNLFNEADFNVSTSAQPVDTSANPIGSGDDPVDSTNEGPAPGTDASGNPDPNVPSAGGEGGNGGNSGNNGGNGGNDGNNGGAAAATTTSQKIVEVTDAEGNTVTDAEGNAVTSISIVTNPNVPAATNANRPAGGNSTNTGDSAFVVVAVMVACLGTALVVKKVNVK